MDNQPVAAVMLRSPQGRILMMRRVDDGTWAFPAGGIKDGETPEEGAWRECWEETGHRCGDVGKLHMRRIKDGVDCSTFLCEGVDEFIPQLNHEHDAWGWFPAEHALADDSTAGQRADDARADGPFREEDHPRGKGEKGGQFVKKGEGGGSEGGEEPREKREPFEPAQAKGGATRQPARPAGWKPNTGIEPPPSRKGYEFKRATFDKQKGWTHGGKPVPFQVPPAYTDLHMVTTKGSPLLAQSLSGKGKWQYHYAETHTQDRTVDKFKRINTLAPKFPKIKAANEKLRSSRDPTTRALADCLALVMSTGLRPGSPEGSRGELGDVATRGATTLQGGDVVARGGKVVLEFVGKGGKTLDIPVSDPSVAKMLLERSKAVGKKGALFGDITDTTLRRHTAQFGPYTTKDFRTLKATTMARQMVLDTEPPPANDKAFKTMVNAVADAVSQSLGNTRAMALKSYIDPRVWKAWR